ncbi:Uncharacterised protein [uncultured archaeon]|nr:Uncharacterised protein [uncultured archaeon]
MRRWFLLIFLFAFAGANNVALFTFCPAFSSQDITTVLAKLSMNGVSNCTTTFNLTVIDPVGNSTQYSPVCANGILTFSIVNNLGGKYSLETTNSNITFKHDTCFFTSLKKSKVSIPDSNFYSIALIFVLAGFTYYRRKK